jgi:hypothetical protein
LRPAKLPLERPIVPGGPIPPGYPWGKVRESGLVALYDSTNDSMRGPTEREA